MKCYFDESRDAQGQCQMCGRFASREYSRIQSGKFVCLECAYGGEEGVLKEVVSILENSAAKCGVCGMTIYQWSTCYKQNDFVLLWRVLSEAQQGVLEEKYVDARWSCPNHCLHCPDHSPQELGSGSEYRYECSICGEKWDKRIRDPYSEAVLDMLSDSYDYDTLPK